MTAEDGKTVIILERKGRRDVPTALELDILSPLTQRKYLVFRKKTMLKG